MEQVRLGIIVEKQGHQKGHRSDPDEQVLVRLHPRSAAQPYAERGREGYAGGHSNFRGWRQLNQIRYM